MQDFLERGLININTVRIDRFRIEKETEEFHSQDSNTTLKSDRSLKISFL